MAEQSYANHAHRPVAWSLAWLGAVIASVMLLWEAWLSPTSTAIALVILSLVVLGGLSLLRVFALRLQDRIIRVEMRVRLARVGREAAFDRLTLRQLVALRFASDGELPALADRAIAEQLTSDQIKRAVTNWQPDLSRT
jgi:hypothetical protein